jgi:hypothetical protein
MMAGGLLSLVVAAGCSGSQPEMSTESSTSAIRAAKEIGAEDIPRASLHLQLAQEELALAEAMEEKGENDKAASQLMRAEADAELAILLSREENEKADAALAIKRVRELQARNR